MSFSPSLLLVLLFSQVHILPVRASPMTRASTADSSKGVIVQMFQWSWDSIAAECTGFLGPAGYGYVQASPAQEHIIGDTWWTDYQPVSYNLTSKRGDRAQFQNMINTCHAAGVKVIADTIFNHMTGSASGSGVAGSTYTEYVYPGIYQSQDFHYCGLETDNLLTNWFDEEEVWTCQLEGLADLATDTEYVRSRLAEYANDLISLGVDGLRLDAAKSIPPSDIANITSRLTPIPYITQEVVWGDDQPVTPELYTDIGNVQEFRYTTAVMNAFSGDGIADLQNLDDQGWIDSSVANVFVTNHDTERYGPSLNYTSPHNTYVTALIFSLASTYGNTVTILSSYSFSDINAGAPNEGNCSGTGGSGDGWICQHRWVAITGMTAFRNNVGTAEMTNWVSPQSNQIAFGRGNLGFIAINNDDFEWSTTFTTSLGDGTYCDAISGVVSSSSCTGTNFTVSGGSFDATVPARSAIAIHTGAML
ncbi:glycoside hydrolase family 13 protein [Collybiopsis luxurians FD-317 M1]|uniref:Alpha-amylase n=1 Tax=Collybiopsis luxurians FD-317 M1 TaxID=944289 RepID=A0A0D0C0R2_9AGAR|nr:glycoside hydrolase family 13 protein [Collybiopsis luxurians FD-317 M1]